MTQSLKAADLPLVEPDAAGGLREVFRRRYLLRLLVQRELRARYKSSVLGLGWSYVRPGVSFAVYFLVVGQLLGAARTVEDFAIFLFSGMVLINLFNDILHSTVRSVTGHAALVRKLYLPREMFPTASVLVSLVHFVPGMLILTTASIFAGWTPSVSGVADLLLGVSIILSLGMGLGLLLAAGNVFLRDLEQAVDVASMIIMWSVPMIYPWTLVRDLAPDWVLTVYLENPLVSAVSLFQKSFWFPGSAGGFEFPPNLHTHALAALGLGLAVFVIGQLVFDRAQRRFGQEL